MLSVEQNINFNKNEKESKMENPTQRCQDINLALQHICEPRVFKVKLWWVWASERKKSAFFVTFSSSEGNLFNVCVLCQCIMYWIHFQNIKHTFTYQKTLLHKLLLLVLKSSKAFSGSLKELRNYNRNFFFVSATRIGENTTSILNCYVSW